MILPELYVDDIIRSALKEDINYIDVASDYLLDETQIATANFLAKAEGVLCGLEVALRVFTLLSSKFQFEVYKKDGDHLQKGDIIAKVTGPVTLLLKGERTSLNLIQHMSGIATATNELVSLVEGTRATIADTRNANFLIHIPSR
jgi:nicotinate-nucleotide pyrophosphorylase (carboxylating)